MSRKENLKIRPYARLLTMLGDQLIKDESIALIELVKNAYDADAENVKISFQDFNADFSITDESAIIIDDDGNGMNYTILKEAWMNPATPEKLKRKIKKSTTDKGRIMQGEKGIGRFAIFKLGREISVITRRQKWEDDHFIDLPDSESEYVLKYDFSDYDTDFLKKGEEEKDIYLDDLTVGLEERKPEEIVPSSIVYSGVLKTRKAYGTKIKITRLNGRWSKEKVDKVYRDIVRMQPIFGSLFAKDFSVHIDIDGKTYIPSEKRIDEILDILEKKSVFIIEGGFNAEDLSISYKLDNHNSIEEYRFQLFGSDMQGISPMKEFFESLSQRTIECGSFSYKFYILDLAINVKDGDSRFYLDPEEKKNVKAHRVYLYRDGIRVMPYGDPEDDWLKLDTIRGIESAGHIFGNDQIVGYISISHKDNPKLRDKTNREGLIEDGHAREDLVNICQLILRYIRTKDYARYLIEKKNKTKKRDEVLGKPISLINKAREENIEEKVLNEVLGNSKELLVSNISPERIEAGRKYVKRFLDEFEQSYRKEVDVLENRIFATENLAAIGLSAETAYHDSRIILNQINSSFATVLINYKNQEGEVLDKKSVINDLNPIKNQVSNVTKLMSNLQRLFPSTKTKKSLINVQQVITMVRNLYSESLKGANIECSINNTSKEKLLVECTDAVLLQVFINLFDNSIYWLKTINTSREIKIQIDVINRTVVFADSGPGIRNDDAPYIFDAFYTGKGETGKGLGLYIARQLLERYNSRIELVYNSKQKLLDGANFILTFDNMVEE